MEENAYLDHVMVRIIAMHTVVAFVGWFAHNILPPLEEDHIWARHYLICQRTTGIIDGEDTEVAVIVGSGGGVYVKRLGVHLGRPICLEDCSSCWRRTLSVNEDEVREE